ncbi:hypothetical protein J3R82DRAFT_5973 [Butyriboletus roseoflavus]|nr:hypothetical protein J3R82DRAFT_5973 [Butyriboletus roseoflavus]
MSKKILEKGKQSGFVVGLVLRRETRVAEVDIGIKHARAARRKRWICLIITIIVILAAVGIGVGVYFAQHPPSSSSSSSSGG